VKPDLDLLDRAVGLVRPEEDRPFERLVRRRDRRRRSERLAALAVGLAVAVAAVWAGATFTRTSHVPANGGKLGPVGDGALTMYSRDSVGLAVVDPASGKATSFLAFEPDAWDWSPDGTRLAYLDTTASTCDLYVVAIGARDPRHVTTCAGGPQNVSWSPDGTTIAFVDDGRVAVIPAAGGSTTRIGPQGSVESPTWSPDGSRIAFSLDREVFTMSPDGSDVTRVTRGFLAAWSPDGRWIAFTRDPLDPRNPNREGDPYVLQAWIAHPDGTDARKVFQRRGCCIGAVSTIGWSPSGDRLAMTAGSLLVADVATGRVTVRRHVLTRANSAWRPVPQP
jgi:dipeptidyl aminopeptidase/acylaminoacyl peptidase